MAGRLLEHRLNIEDSQMTILRGHFTMTLVVSAPEEVDADALARDLEQTREGLGLEALSLDAVADLEPAGGPPQPSHIVTVYGVDHPGIVFSVASALAERRVNITDLQTRLVGEDDEPLYVMMLEVAPPEDLTVEELESVLEAAGREQGVEVTVRPLEPDPL